MITVELIAQINSILAFFGLLSIAALLFLVFDLKTEKRLQTSVQKYGHILILILATGASILTLVYSEIFGIVPCGFCWFERILLYPQVILALVAYKIKDRYAFPRYGIVLSLGGLIVSLYHHYIQMGGSQFLKCPSSGEGTDCAKRFFFEYDFMTFPLLAAILFAILIALYMYIKRDSSNSIQ